jgi:transcriptional regulator with XRE-family HTH domain
VSITKEQLTDLLRDSEFRGHFTSDQVYELLAVQIRQLREKHRWTQTELGDRAGMQQVQVSRAENPDYKGTRISTLSKLADAFDVALIVRLAPFSELIDWVAKLSPASFEPASFGEELFTLEHGASQARAFDALVSASDNYFTIDLNTYKRALTLDEPQPSSVRHSVMPKEEYQRALA